MTDWLHWLMTPISGAQTHSIAPWAYWHARLMVLAWAFALPLGVMAARFFKVTPGQDWPQVKDNKAWWRAHRSLQYTGVIAMLFGLYLALGQGSGRTAAALWHARLGWAVVALGVLQIGVAWGRGSKGGPTGLQMAGDHYDMTPWRTAFEWTHKAGGYLALLIAVAAVFTGLTAADAPRWMWLAIGLWWLSLVVAFAVLQGQGRCMDTYQAIWGPDTGTEASRKRPIGWGVRRYTASQWTQKFGPARNGPQRPTKQ